MPLYREDVAIFQSLSSKATTSNSYLTKFYILLFTTTLSIVIYSFYSGDLSISKKLISEVSFLIWLGVIISFFVMYLNPLIGILLFVILYYDFTMIVSDKFYSNFYYLEYISIVSTSFLGFYILKSLFISKKQYNMSLKTLSPMILMLVIFFTAVFFKSFYLLNNHVNYTQWMYIQLLGTISIALSFYYTNIFLEAKEHISSIIHTLRLKYLILFLLIFTTLMYIDQNSNLKNVFDALINFFSLNKNAVKSLSILRQGSFGTEYILALVALVFSNFFSMYFIIDSILASSDGNKFSAAILNTIFLFIVVYAFTTPIFSLFIPLENIIMFTKGSLFLLILAIFSRNLIKRTINIAFIAAFGIFYITAAKGNLSVFAILEVSKQLFLVGIVFSILAILPKKLFIALYYKKITFFAFYILIPSLFISSMMYYYDARYTDLFSKLILK